MLTTRLASRLVVLTGVVLSCAVACGSSDDGAAQPAGASGGAGGGGTAAGGAATMGSGGALSNGGSSSGGSASGGANASAGGQAGTASGGASTAGGSGNASGAPNLPGWTLVWSDEFDGPAGSAVDGSKWNLVNKGDGFGNNELEFYTDRTDNAAMDGSGNLVITAKKETHSGKDYTSARLESAGKFERAYGRIESRLKVPFGQGIWPAFWMLGNDVSTPGIGWPKCGEIDIMENIGKEPSTVHGSLHGPGYSGANPLGAPYDLEGGKQFKDDFHVFAVEWEEKVIRFYVDDHLYVTRTDTSVPTGGTWVYDHPFFILLNVAVGGQWPGSPDGSTTFPQKMLVDYVRVYGR